MVSVTLLTWIRRLSRLAYVHLFADMAILFGISLVMYFAGVKVTNDGVDDSVQMINSSSFLAFIGNVQLKIGSAQNITYFHLLPNLGNAIYTYEGVGIILPVYVSLSLCPILGIVIYKLFLGAKPVANNEEKGGFQVALEYYLGYIYRFSHWNRFIELLCLW
mmetsp:Transcript_39888/g.45501  ORF Transcript_39888/g.45501 Transcript_39888/m.45501 type:complete len:162 (-) Transcript_39888:174-659(-)